MINPRISSAILAINPTAEITVIANDINQITWRNETPVISNEDILAKLAELQAEYNAKKYHRDRSLKFMTPNYSGYPSISNQLDMMWHDKKDGTTTWEDAIQAVKDAHPKP